MSSGKIKSIPDVVRNRLCVGCGACAYLRPDLIKLCDFPSEGIRPVVADEREHETAACLAVCPGVETDFALPADSPSAGNRPLGDSAFVNDWGRVIEVWEGHASDPDIRNRGSSGGALTALAVFGLERDQMGGVLHTGQDPSEPVRNRTRLSRTRAEVIGVAGSRYSPASVCDGLQQVEDAAAPCVIIGKPAEISALRRAEKIRPALSAKVGVALSFFCAESPSTQGTLELLARLNVPPGELRELRYRGFGWPGHFAPVRQGESTPCAQLTYQESWAFLQKYRPWSVHLWPDGSGELADISCGDPWYEKPDGKNPGSSLIVVRTERGRAFLQRAMAAGYLQLTRAEPWKVTQSQSNLANKKAAVWGRLLAMRLVGLPTPRFLNAHLLGCWVRLSLGEKLKSVVGTLRRIQSRKLRTPLTLPARTGRLVSPVPAPSDQH